MGRDGPSLAASFFLATFLMNTAVNPLRAIEERDSLAPSRRHRTTVGEERVGPMAVLFAITAFLAASLLFLVEPLAARMVLPILGGSPAVWTTCMLFFQSCLLAGYGYAHFLASRSGIGRQAIAHGVFVILAALFLPIRTPAPSMLGQVSSGYGPTLALLGWLVGSLGLPFVAVAATAPLLQSWYASAGSRSARDPYFLYAASNAGSLTALVVYPSWVERRLDLGRQASAWSSGFAFLAVLLAVCAVAGFQQKRMSELESIPETGSGVTRKDWFSWVVLALIPSSLMLGLTTYVTTDLAAIPLLWVIPLALYLLSFIIVFGKRPERVIGLAGRVFPILVMILTPVLAAGLARPYWMILHILTFFAAAIVCHGDLAQRRPAPERLTSFYLAMAIGGALGGVFNAIVAPLVFDRIAEYPLAIVAACLVPAFPKGRGVGQGICRRDLILPAIVGALSSALCANLGGLANRKIGVVVLMAASGLGFLVILGHRKHPARFALMIGAILLASTLDVSVSGRVIFQGRDFFGVLKVTETQGGRIHRLFHGNTLHGQQDMSPARRSEPSTYFARSGPIGEVFAAFDVRSGSDRAAVAVTGVGAGSLAAYARPGQSWTFFEIDPAVVRVASNPRYFTFLSDCRADRLDLVVGDARLTMEGQPDGRFDLIILDAFSSDAIPVHLLTREAIAGDRRKRSAGGLIVVNITNRYLDLTPVIAALGRDAGMICRVRFDPRDRQTEAAKGKQGSIWAILADREKDLGPIADDPRWQVPEILPDEAVWTDQFSNVLDHLRAGRSPRRP